MERDGVVEATEERHPAHFHVAVFANAPLRQVAARTERTPERTPARTAERTPARTAERTPARTPSRTAVRPGITTTVSNGAVYRVRPGDTLWDIARKRDVTVARLRAANGLRRGAIRPGQTLVIPSESAASGEAADQ